MSSISFESAEEFFSSIASAPAPPAPESSWLERTKVGLWRGASERGSTGLLAAEGYVARCAFEIPALPDFSSPRFPDLCGLEEAQRIQRVGETQGQLLAALHALGPRFGFSLRYVCTRSPGGEGRIRLMVVGRSFDSTERGARESLSSFRETLQHNLPAGYRAIEREPGQDAEVDAALSLEGISTMVEILKPEQVLPAWHSPELCGFSFYYAPQSFAASEGDMIGFCAALVNHLNGVQVDPGSHRPDGPLVLDVTLTPALPLTEVERGEVATWCGVCEKWGRDQKVKVGGGLYSDPTPMEIAADPHAQEMKKAYADLTQRYGNPQGRCFLYAVRVLSPTDVPPESVASALAARALLPGSRPQLMVLDRNHPAFPRALNAARNLYVTPAVCNERLWSHPEAPETLRRLHRLADLKEVAGFFRLPIPGRDGCPGVPLDPGLPESSPASTLPVTKGVRIGRFVEGTRVTVEAAALSPADLTKHGLIVGTPGSGKTTLCFSLLAQLWGEHRIPFLVLEPAKTEYRALKDHPALHEDLLVFTVGNERVSPFRFNPFEILPGESVSEHLSTLATCFQGAFNLFDPLPMIFESALREVYLEKGWSEYGVGGEGPELETPTLSDLYAKALELADSTSYKGEVAGNIRGALETRLGSLLRGPRGRCFNARRSLPMDLLMDRPVVLELEALNEEEKALAMLFLLARIRAYAKTASRSSHRLSHLTLLEEAHTVIGRGEGGASEHRANPKAASIRFVTRMLAEMRALGEGVLIADQLPTAIAPEAVKLTNLKVMHRVVALEDRKEMGGAMVLDEGQVEGAAVLPPGVSYVFREGWPKSRLVQEPNFKDETGVDVPPPDETLKGWMEGFRTSDAAREAYLPYPNCGILCRACDGRVREEMERWTDRKRPEVRRKLGTEPKAQPVAVALSEYFRDLPLSKDEPVRVHCAREHFWQTFGSELGKEVKKE